MLLANLKKPVVSSSIHQQQQHKLYVCAANDLIVLNILQCAVKHTHTQARLTKEATTNTKIHTKLTNKNETGLLGVCLKRLLSGASFFSASLLSIATSEKVENSTSSSYQLYVKKIYLKLLQFFVNTFPLSLQPLFLLFFCFADLYLFRFV